MQIPLDQVTGPVGALVVLGILTYGLSVAIKTLWKDHLRSDQRDRDIADRAYSLAETVVPLVKDMAESMAAANKDAAGRHRRGDDG